MPEAQTNRHLSNLGLAEKFRSLSATTVDSATVPKCMKLAALTMDKEREPELRHTVLSLVAFQDLQRLGLEAFLNQNNGEGWLLPETLRLSDYGLSHDDRARELQPVAARLGERFYPWQLERTVEESRRHAENLRLIRSVGAPAAPPPPPEGGTPNVPATD